MFGVFYIYISIAIHWLFSDWLFAVFYFCSLQGGAVIIGLYHHHHEVLFCFCFFFFIVGVLERHFGGLGGFLSLLQFLL